MKPRPPPKKLDISVISIHIRPLVAAQSNRELAPRRRRSAVLALLYDAIRTPSVAPQLLEASLGLTKAQSVVAALLAEGHGVSEIAAITYRSESAVRWHIRRMHANLNVSRTLDLIRICLTQSMRDHILNATSPR